MIILALSPQILFLHQPDASIINYLTFYHSSTCPYLTLNEIVINERYQFNQHQQLWIRIIIFTRNQLCEEMQILSLQYVQEAIEHSDLMFQCCDVHPGFSCNQKFMIQFIRVVKPVLKTYMPVHIVPFLLFKRKKFMQNPLLQLFKLFLGIIRSVIFGAGYYCTFKRMCCLLFGDSYLSPFRLKIGAALGGIPLLFEHKGRQAEIALFTMYKTFQTMYNIGKRRDWPVRIPAGNCNISGTALCIICYHYTNNRKNIKESFLQVLDKLLLNI